MRRRASRRCRVAADLLRGRTPGLRLPRGRLSIRVRGRRSRPGRRRSVALGRGPCRRTRGGGMRSHVLEGRVRHRRARPFVYNLEHGVTYLALDLDELDGIENAAWLIRRNRRGLLEIRDVDHLDPPAEDLERRSTTFGGRRRDPAGWQVTLVTNPACSGTCSTPRRSTCAATRRASCGSSSSRCTTRTASGTCTRSVRGRVVIHSSPRWTRSSTCRRSSRRAAGTPSGCETSRPACGSRSTTRQPRGCCSTQASTSPGGH